MATEKRMISPDVFWDNLDLAPSEWVKASTIKAILDETPTVDAVEVVPGRWEKHGKHDWRCSNCKIGVPYSYTGHKYCPNCGAKMDLKGD